MGILIETFLLIALTEAATLLNYLDLVAVGIGDEEKARECRAVMLEIAQRPGREFLALEAGVSASRSSTTTAIGRIRRPGRRAPCDRNSLSARPRKRRRMTKIDQRKVRKFQMVGHFEPKARA